MLRLDTPTLIFTAIAAFLILTAYRWVFSEDESAIEYNVPVPEPCQQNYAGELELLKSPSISVSMQLLKSSVHRRSDEMFRYLDRH